MCRNFTTTGRTTPKPAAQPFQAGVPVRPTPAPHDSVKLPLNVELGVACDKLKCVRSTLIYIALLCEETKRVA